MTKSLAGVLRTLVLSRKKMKGEGEIIDQCQIRLQ